MTIIYLSLVQHFICWSFRLSPFFSLLSNSVNRHLYAGNFSKFRIICFGKIPKSRIIRAKSILFFFLTLDTHYPVALIEGFKNQQWLLSVKPKDFVSLLFLLFSIWVCWLPLWLNSPSPKFFFKWHCSGSLPFSQATSSLSPLTS